MAVKRTTISVPEMGRWLGLGKTRTYDVLRENDIETIKVGNGIKKYTRVILDSFEEWYTGQTHYKKVVEECPIGASFYHPTPDPRPVDEQIRAIFGDRIVYTVEEARMFLVISRTGMYDLVGLNLFPSTKVNNKYVIPADLFHEWAEDQKFFSLSAEYDLRKDMMARFKGCFFNQQEGTGEPMNLPDLSDITENIAAEEKSEVVEKTVVIKEVQIDDATIPVEVEIEEEPEVEFVMPDNAEIEARRLANNPEAQMLKLLKKEQAPVVKPEKNYYTVQEVVKMMNCPTSRVYRLIDTKVIRSKKVGPRVLIFKKEFDEWFKAGGK